MNHQIMDYSEFTVYCTYPLYPEKDKLKIDLQYETNIKTICQIMNFRKNIKFLNLLFRQYYKKYFYDKDQSNDDSVLKQISNSISEFIQLETIFIIIDENCGFKSQQMKILINQITKIGKQLTQLDFFVKKGNQLEFDGTKYLAQGISNCPNLKTLRIKINDQNSITKDGAIILGQAIGSCENLQELLIYIEGEDHKIGPEGAKGLSDGIKNLKNLKKLAIRIWWKNQLGPEGAFYLTNYIPSLLHLKSLFLEFGTDNYYTYEGAVHISNGLKSCKNLEELTFIMWNNSNITGEGFKLICQAFQELINLKKFEVLFYGESNFDSLSLMHLKDIFQHLQKLEHIFIKLNPFQKILQHPIKLIKELQKIESLRVLNLRYSNYQDQESRKLNNYILKKFKRLVIKF